MFLQYDSVKGTARAEGPDAEFMRAFVKEKYLRGEFGNDSENTPLSTEDAPREEKTNSRFRQHDDDDDDNGGGEPGDMGGGDFTFDGGEAGEAGEAGDYDINYDAFDSVGTRKHGVIVLPDDYTPNSSYIMDLRLPSHALVKDRNEWSFFESNQHLIQWIDGVYIFVSHSIIMNDADKTLEDFFSCSVCGNCRHDSTATADNEPTLGSTVSSVQTKCSCMKTSSFSLMNLTHWANTHFFAQHVCTLKTWYIT